MQWSIFEASALVELYSGALARRGAIPRRIFVTGDRVVVAGTLPAAAPSHPVDKAFIATAAIDALTSTGSQRPIAKNLGVYPNPTEGVLYLGRVYEGVYLYGPKGQLLLERKRIDRLDLGKLGAGVYVLRLMEGDRTSVARVVRQ